MEALLPAQERKGIRPTTDRIPGKRRLLSVPVRSEGLGYKHTTDWVEKAADDLTPRTKENITLEELMQTWMAKMHDNCLFISARQRENIEELKELLYKKVKELHVQKYPYNDFLYQTYDNDGTPE